jgi:methanogenic corrinoid protein MtbC1
MTGTRQLIEAFGQWQSCEDLSAKDGLTSRNIRSTTNDEINRAMLGQTIEAEVIPRLMLAHTQFALRTVEPREPRALHIAPEDVAELARIVIEHDTEVASSYIETLRGQGVPVEAIYVDLLAPTARVLGEMWKADLCDFTDVTIGISRLQQLVHELSPDFERETSQQFEGRRILLVTMPGEQHTLGLMLVEEYFRRSGWDCCSSAPKDSRDLARLVRGQHFDVIGLSVSWDVLIEGVASAIQALRKASLNKSVTILVGGSVFHEHPEYVSRVGADGTADDGRHALLQLRHLLAPKVTGA